MTRDGARAAQGSGRCGCQKWASPLIDLGAYLRQPAHRAGSPVRDTTDWSRRERYCAGTPPDSARPAVATRGRPAGRRARPVDAKYALTFLVGSPAPGRCFPRPVVHGARSVVIDRHRLVALSAAAISVPRTCYAKRCFAQAAHGPADPLRALGGTRPFDGPAGCRTSPTAAARNP